MAVNATNNKGFKMLDIIAPTSDGDYMSHIDRLYDSQQEGLAGKAVSKFDVYRFSSYMDMDKALSKGIKRIRFSFFTKLDDARNNKVHNAYESFEVPLREDDEETLLLGVRSEVDFVKAKVQKSSLKKVFADSEVSRLAAAPALAPSGLSISLDGAVPGKMDERHATAMAKARNADPAALSAVGTRTVTSFESANSLDASSTFSKFSNRQFANVSAAQLANKTSVMGKRQELRYQRLGGGHSQNEISKAVPNLPISLGNQSVNDFYLLSSLVDLNLNIVLPSKVSFYYRIDVNLDDLDGYEHCLPIIGEARRSDRLLMQNAEPPDIKVIYAHRDRVRLQLTNVDPHLQRCVVTKIVENPQWPRPRVTNVGHYVFRQAKHTPQYGPDSYSGISSSENVIHVEDSLCNVYPNKTTYRVTAMTHWGTLGQFSSVVVVPEYAVSGGGHPSKNIPVVAVNKKSHVHIQVAPPEDVVSIRLFRQDYSISGSITDQTTQVGKTTVIERAYRGKIIDFYDKSAKLGTTYRYFVTYKATAGRLLTDGVSREEKISTFDDIIVRRYTATSVPFMLSLGPGVIGYDDGITVTFIPEARETKQLYNLVRNSLRRAGISEDFVQKLTDDDIKTKNFVTFLVERYNFTTGLRENLGIHGVGKFQDNPALRAQLGLSDPEPGGKYIYIFKVCLNDSSQFLDASNAGLVNEFGAEIEKKAKRFSNIIFTQLGVLPSETEVNQDISIEEIILNSQVGVEMDALVEMGIGNLAYFTGTKKLELTETPEFTSIKFDYQATPGVVSHFNIYCIVNGGMELLGALSCMGSNKSYAFCDHRFHRVVGTRKYKVEPVAFNGERIPGAREAKLHRKLSIPENGMKGVIYGRMPGVGVDYPRVFEQVDSPPSGPEKGPGWDHYYSVSGLSTPALSSVPAIRQVPNTITNAADFWARVDLPNFNRSQEGGN